MGSGQDWARAFERAALDPSKWGEVLHELAETSGSSRAQLIGLGDKVVHFNVVTHTPAGVWDNLNKAGVHRVEANFRLLADTMFTSTPILHEVHYQAARSRISGGDYDDVCRDMDIPHGCQTVVDRSGDHMIGLALLRSQADGTSTDHTRKMFRHASASVQTAVRMQMAIEQQGMRMMLGLLDSMSVACFLLDSRGCPVGLTPSAEAHLQDPGCGIRLHRGQLLGLRAQVTTQIDNALADILQHGRVRHRRIMVERTLHAPDMLQSGRPWCFDLFRVQQDEWNLSFRPSVVMVLRQPGRMHNAAADVTLLQGAFGLTPAEAAVAIELRNGASRSQIAENRSVGTETLRGQIKTIYAKTGCNREAQLVQLLASLLD